MEILRFLIPFALLIVFGILLTGVFAMARGGEFNRKYGNKLMQYRVAAQFVAIILIALLFFISHN